jgi:hypothetical protein
MREKITLNTLRGVGSLWEIDRPHKNIMKKRQNKTEDYFPDPYARLSIGEMDWKSAEDILSSCGVSQGNRNKIADICSHADVYSSRKIKSILDACMSVLDGDELRSVLRRFKDWGFTETYCRRSHGLRNF